MPTRTIVHHLIDEWDCLFREYQQDKDAQKKISGFSAFLVERQRLHCSCIHDRDTSDKKNTVLTRH